MSFAQERVITGRALEENSGAPLHEVEVSVRSENTVAFTDMDGRFTLRTESPSPVTLAIVLEGRPVYRQVDLTDSITDVGDILISARLETWDDQIFITTLSDDEALDEGENISGLLSASRDVFQSTAAYVFGPVRFRIRGYDSENSLLNLNGMPINDIEVGRPIWSYWGGLNDVTRNQETQIGIQSMPFTFGSVGGGSQIDLRARTQRPQKRFTWSLTNRNYSNRLMGTWSTGMMEDGWAFSVSASHRWADEGYIDGTFYDAYGYFISVDKEISDAHALNMVILGAPTKRGQNGAAIQEMYDLAGTHYYNPYWGYQNGKKRNSRVSYVHQPIANLRHDWKIKENTILTTSIGAQAGRTGKTALDWYKANDPRPDYYRRLPSYFEDPELSARIWDELSGNAALRQVQWDKMYEVNRVSVATIQNVDGVADNDVTGRLSHYIVEERRYDNKRYIAATNLQHVVSDQFGLYGGLHYSQQKVEAYKLVDDLLGGEFYVDYDKFAERDFAPGSDAVQNDLNRPNRPVVEGDQFGYDYDENIRDFGLWAQAEWTLQKLDIFAAAQFGSNTIWRTGHVRNGKFPDNSFGDSEKLDFMRFGAKSGVTVKIDGRNYVWASGLFMQRPPFMRNAMVSPRTRNEFVEGLTEERIYGAEAGYRLTSPYVKARLIGYYTQFRDQTETRSFYHDDERSFVNFSMTGIDKEHLGMEAAAEVTILPGFQVHGVAAVGQYIYNSRPSATITQDNNADRLEEDLTIYAENFYVSGTPQQAYTFGMSYRSEDYWSAYLNFNYFDNVWLDFNPVRRTTDAIDLVDEGSPLWNDILNQEQVPSAFTINASVYKSFLIDWFEEDVYLSINFSVNNALDNTDFITGGYEQLRFDFEGKDPDAFPSRYYYFQGLNYYFNASIRF